MQDMMYEIYQSFNPFMFNQQINLTRGYKCMPHFLLYYYQVVKLIEVFLAFMYWVSLIVNVLILT